MRQAFYEKIKPNSQNENEQTNDDSSICTADLNNSFYRM